MNFDAWCGTLGRRRYGGLQRVAVDEEQVEALELLLAPGEIGAPSEQAQAREAFSKVLPRRAG
ncbi:hypothetical protein [Cellulomonas xiejunii]|uniref:Uncharacterized protein n=1 Tax=Cellulomonas xiejunii TaxID=2968083 RepID=A0ABY5KQY9_9CELL|nr:hypothetical protein [Cellulomonas xiejunii]MCC2321273.1 hypothetical protein [Cellulomonas xiejunii]UUI71861.1 hypothetical protein NP048_19075 [Cellulomonas xiejunii]